MMGKLKDILKNKNHVIISTEESLEDVEPIEWSDDVINGDKKVIVTEKEEVGIIVDTPDTVNKKIKIADIVKESNNIIQSIANDFKGVIYKESSKKQFPHFEKNE